MLLSFFSKVKDSCAACKLTCLDSGSANFDFECGIRRWIFKESELKFNSQNPSHSLVDSRLRNSAFFNKRKQMIGETIIDGYHAHIDAGHDRHVASLLFHWPRCARWLRVS